MKKLRTHQILFRFIIISNLFIYGCSNSNSDDDIIAETILTPSDKDALLFMLEEEKLARDTYIFLDNIWSVNPFTNIINSEQTHMNAVENLLKQHQINYNILPIGKFENQDLQNLYNKFKIDGVSSMSSALKIGATIEDLDIVDLQSNIDGTTNQSIISVFQSLQCGSRNHLKSFVNAIENNNDTYLPQFLSNEEYTIIIESNHEKCNKN